MAKATLTPAEKHVVLVGGEGGWLNLGDQAMLAEVARRYRSTGLPVRFTVLCHLPECVSPMPAAQLSTALADWFRVPQHLQRFTQRIPRVRRAWFRWRGKQLVRAAARRGAPTAGELPALLRTADAVHLYGGGCLNSLWPDAACWPFCYLLQAAHAAGKPVYVTGQGLGPLHSEEDRALVRSALHGARLVTIREAGDANPLLTSLFGPAQQPRPDGDDAVSLAPCTPERAEAILAQEVPPTPRPLLAVHYRHIEYVGVADAELLALARLLDRLIAELNLHVVFIPMQYAEGNDDGVGAFRLWRHLQLRHHATVLAGPLTASETRGVVGRCAAAIGFSYHFALFALAEGLPTVGLYQSEYYRLKMLGLFRQFAAEEWAVPVAEQARVPELLQQALRAPEPIALRHRRQAAAMENRVSDTFTEIAAGIFAAT